MSREADAVERTIFIEAEPETVLGFFVDPSLMAEGFGISHILEARPGGTFRVEVSQGNVAIWVFTNVRPYRRVTFTWGWESADAALAAPKPGASRVEIDLHRRMAERASELTHTGFPKKLKTYTQNAGLCTSADWRRD
jgi:uncharacterized protein YndB with AHSA1/START domain